MKFSAEDQTGGIILWSKYNMEFTNFKLARIPLNPLKIPWVR